MKDRLLLFLSILYLGSCSGPSGQDPAGDAQTFIDEYTTRYLELDYSQSKAEWASNTRIVEGDTLNTYNTTQASEAKAMFSGSEEIINQARMFLSQKETLSPIQVKQLEVILYKAANNPATAGDLVKERIKASTLQEEKTIRF